MTTRMIELPDPEPSQIRLATQDGQEILLNAQEAIGKTGFGSLHVTFENGHVDTIEVMVKKKPHAKR